MSDNHKAVSIPKLWRLGVCPDPGSASYDGCCRKTRLAGAHAQSDGSALTSRKPTHMSNQTTIPTTEPDGQFSTFVQWVNKATSWIGGENALCVDAQNRVCRNGGDFMRARDEGAFPVRFYFDAGKQSPAEQRKNARRAARKLGRAWL